MTFGKIGCTKLANMLPYDMEVEYLESTGTQWIDTGITPQNNSTVVFNAMVGVSTQSSSRRFLYGDGNSSISHYSDIRDMKYGSHLAYCNVVLQPSVLYRIISTFTPTNLTHQIDVQGQSYSITSSSYASSSWGKLVLFRLNSSYTGSHQMLGHMQIIINGKHIKDFIPVRYTNQNRVYEGMMYDRISKQLFRNQGTGSFIIGPDKT